MKYLYTLLFIFTIIVSQAQPIIPPNTSKTSDVGKTIRLSERFKYHTEFNTDKPKVPFKISAKNSPSIQSVTNCDCFFTRDSTYSVVPFDGPLGNGAPGSPPDYRNDDSYTDNPIILPFNFCFYGQTTNAIYINNNGNISFGSSYSTFTALSFPDPTYSMIAPFWGDVDTRGTLSGIVYYKMTSTALIIQWDQVGYYNMWDDLLNTFQLIITDGNDPLIPGGNNVAFCYKDMQWTTGDASGGSGGFGGTAATVGANYGDGINYIQFGTFDQPGNAYNGPYGGGDGIDWLDNQNFNFNVCNSSFNIPPVVQGLQLCGDTVTVCADQILFVPINFLSPEIGQITTITDSASPGYTSYSFMNNQPGNPATTTLLIGGLASNVGYNTIIIKGTDNGSPAASSSITLTVLVVANPTPPVITGDSLICNGTSTTLVATGSYSNYLWSNGKTTSNIAASPGTYTVTVSNMSGCSATSSFHVVSAPITIPVISGLTGQCGSDSTWLICTPSTYDSIVWNTGTLGDSLFTNSGSYSVYVLAANGCTASATFNLVVNSDPLADFSTLPACTNANVFFTDLTTLQGIPITNWNWAFGDGTFSSLQNPQHFYNNQSVLNYNVTLIATAANGCSDTIIKSITRIPAPVANFTFSSGCIGQGSTFVDSSTVSGGNITSWSWNFGNGNFSSSQNPINFYSNNLIYAVNLVVTASNGCMDTVTKNFQALLPPIASFTNSTGCAKTPFNFNDFSAQPGGAVSNWSWNFGDGTPINTL